MSRFMQERLHIPDDQVADLRENYYHEYGTTLKGLEIHYAVDPVEYLTYVHDVDVTSFIQPDPKLQTLLDAIPQEKIICTNSDQAHTQRVTSALGIADRFDRVVDVLQMAPYCKPAPESFLKMIQIAGDPSASHYLLLDDSLRNVESARDVGLYAVLVRGGCTCPEGIPQIERIHDLPRIWNPETGRFHG